MSGSTKNESTIPEQEAHARRSEVAQRIAAHDWSGALEAFLRDLERERPKCPDWCRMEHPADTTDHEDHARELVSLDQGPDSLYCELTMGEGETSPSVSLWTSGSIDLPLTGQAVATLRDLAVAFGQAADTVEEVLGEEVSSPTLPMVTISEAAQMLGVKPWPVYEECMAGRLVHGRVGGVVVIPRGEVERFAREVVGSGSGAALLGAVRDAEAQALAAHRGGTCSASEWSCSYCEAEDR